MVYLLAEAGWTPSMTGAAIISAVIVGAKIIPWIKSRNGNGNGSANAARDGEARGEMRAKIDAHRDELKRQNKTDEDQWTAINETRGEITALKGVVDRTASDVCEMKDDLKAALKKGGGDD